jgi:hypothetical protein
MFASETLREHLARGATGVIGLALASWLAAAHPIAGIACAAIGMIALRGCPMCWTMGLAQTLIAKLRGKPAPDACIDGSCSLRE